MTGKPFVLKKGLSETYALQFPETGRTALGDVVANLAPSADRLEGQFSFQSARDPRVRALLPMDMNFEDDGLTELNLGTFPLPNYYANDLERGMSRLAEALRKAFGYKNVSTVLGAATFADSKDDFAVRQNAWVSEDDGDGTTPKKADWEEYLGLARDKEFATQARVASEEVAAILTGDRKAPVSVYVHTDYQRLGVSIFFEVFDPKQLHCYQLRYSAHGALFDQELSNEFVRVNPMAVNTRNVNSVLRGLDRLVDNNQNEAALLRQMDPHAQIP